jgi:hypothetical protein
VKKNLRDRLGAYRAVGDSAPPDVPAPLPRTFLPRMSQNAMSSADLTEQHNRDGGATEAQSAPHNLPTRVSSTTRWYSPYGCPFIC